MEGHFSTGQSPQWAVVPMEEEEGGGGGGGGGEGEGEGEGEGGGGGEEGERGGEEELYILYHCTDILLCTDGI